MVFVRDLSEVSLSMLKKFFRKAVKLVHPDRHAQAPLEEKIRAELVFAALDNAYNRFVATNTK